MENKNVLSEKLENVFIASVIIITVAFMRIIPHIPNLAPVGGLALFSGAHLNKKWAILLPLGAMIVSDIILGFHSTIFYVYGSFILITFLGQRLKKNPSARSLLSISLVSSTLFFFITNFGVWAATPLYSKDVAGLTSSFVMGLPFFRNTILGDLLYTFVFFYGFSYIKNLRFRFNFT